MLVKTKQHPIGGTRLLALPVLFALAACATDASAPVAPAADRSRSENGGLIAWTQWVAYTGHAITIAKPDGSGERQLTTPIADLYEDGHADWSPDGSVLIFERDWLTDMGTSLIYRVRPEGGDLTQLGDCSGDCLGHAFPSYSPDASKIAFIKWIGPVRDDGSATSGGIWIMDADGSHQVQITQRRLPTTTEDSHPRWSPDGRHLAFMRLNTVAEPQWHQAIFVANADGSGAHRITPWSLDANAPDWSPDGRLILVSSHNDNSAMPPAINELYTVRPDGSDLRKVRPEGLDRPAGTDVFAANGKFSPDGRSIVFNHQIQSDWCCVIYRMSADGKDVVRVSQSDSGAFAPNWGGRP